MTYSTIKFEVATSNGLEGNIFTRNVMDVRTDGQTDGRMDERRTDFDTKLIYPFFLKKKAGIMIFLIYHNQPKHMLHMSTQKNCLNEAVLFFALKTNVRMGG